MANWSPATVLRSLGRLAPRVFSTQAEPASRSRRLQFMSDLHLEIGQQYASFDFPVAAPYLILGGDIGRLIDYDGYLSFFQRQVARYERVFFVLGNHEFYGLSYHEGIVRAQQLEREDSLGGKVVLLHQGRHDLGAGPEPAEPDITILGCILWSHIPAKSAGTIATSVNDFKQIHEWTTDAHNSAHAADLEWLQAELERIRQEDMDKPESRCVVIVTHHAPLMQGTASPRHEGSPCKSAFATDICIGARWKPVKHWVFGHTHWTTDLEAANGVHIVSNQRGYVFPGNTRPVDQGGLELPTKHNFDPVRCIQL